MNLRFGLREADIARRGGSVVSWLDYRDHMTGKELAGLFSEWNTGPYANQAYMLTELALQNLADRGIVQETELAVRGVGFRTFRLAGRSVANSIDPNTVELAPRETVLLGSMDIRRGEAHAPAELDRCLGLQGEPDDWRTEACLGHLARLGLVHAVDGPPASAYILPHPQDV